jgi:hypothetical protein
MSVNLERVERRDSARLPGGSREDDPELTVAELAAWTGNKYSVDALRAAIRRGELEAIRAPDAGGRPRYFVTLASWIGFLKRRGYDAGRIAILERVATRQST